MIRTSNSKANIYTTQKQIFKGSHTFSERLTGSGAYVVYSYGYHFPMFIYKNGQWYENEDKYSQSTSKHQSQLRPEINGDFIMLDTNGMKALI